MVSADSYSPVEAARVLGVSEKRIRQLVDAGRIRRVGTSSPLRVSQRSVLELRDKRKAEGRAASSTSTRRSASSPAVDVEAVVTRTVEALVPRMLETASAAALRTEQLLLEQLAAERARAEAAEAELRALRSTLAARRSRWRRSAPETPAEAPTAL